MRLVSSLALVLSLLLVAPAGAQEAVIGSGVYGGTKAATYTGPGDIVSGASAFYSCTRAYNALYASGANKACNIRRASDNHTCDFLFVAAGTLGNSANCSTGGDNGQSLASFLASTTGAVPKAYDHSGNGNDVSQATAANQPTMGANCNSIQCTTYVAATPLLLQSGAITTVNQPYTMASVTERSSNNSAYNKITSGGSSGGAQHFTPTANQVETYCGTTGAADQTASDGTLHSIIGICNGASSVAVVDGSAGTAGNAGAFTWNTEVTLGASAVASQGLGGYIGETGTWPIAFTATQYGNMRTNQKNFWSTP